MAAKTKNSLVANINRRRRAKKSRPKSRSTVSQDSYQEMRRGWPKATRRKTAKKAAKKGKARKKGKTRSSGRRTRSRR